VFYSKQLDIYDGIFEIDGLSHYCIIHKNTLEKPANDGKKEK